MPSLRRSTSLALWLTASSVALAAWSADPAADGLPKLAAQAGVLGYLAERLSSEAPAAAQASPAFKELLGAVMRSVAALNAAVASGDRARIEKAVGQVKAPYSKLFVQFG